MKKVIEVIFDRGSFFEIKPRFGKSASVGLARLDGKVVGVIANNPQTGGGALSAEACRKIVDFTVMCDSFNIPLVRLMDTPGFVVGTDRSEEHTSELQSLMRLSYAVFCLQKKKPSNKI